MIPTVLKNTLILFYITILLLLYQGSSKMSGLGLVSIAQLYLGLGAIGTIFFIHFQNQKNEHLKVKLKALRVQINPHFVSNSLNAIESLINLGNSKAAAKYLVHFSRFSRQILNSSKIATISLRQELKTLKHFLVLEQLRFRDKLTYEIQVASTINQDLVLVPAMILQPYVENAIRQGLQPKASGGHILIKVSQTGNVLSYCIEDNGVGSVKAQEIRTTSVLKDQSMEMQITEERLKAIVRMKGTEVVIQDLVDKEGRACGTRKFIRFPYKLKE